MDLISTLVLHIGLIIVFGTWYYFVCHKANKGEDTLQHAVSSSLSALLSKPIIPVLIVAVGVLSQLFVSGVLNMLHRIIPDAFIAYDELASEVNSADTPFILILCVCLIAPIGEEFLFRGVILHYAKRFMLPILAVLLQAILFGIYHGNVVQGCYATFMGIILGAIAYRFKSIVPSMLLHLAVNLSMYFVPPILFKTYNMIIITTTVSGLLLVGALIKLFGIKRTRSIG